MANKNEKVEDIDPGAYYVDQTCVGHGVCTRIAPNNFDMDDFGYVMKQPETDKQKAACEEAIKSCPSQSIGNDG